MSPRRNEVFNFFQATIFKKRPISLNFAQYHTSANKYKYMQAQRDAYIKGKKKFKKGKKNLYFHLNPGYNVIVRPRRGPRETRPASKPNQNISRLLPERIAREPIKPNDRPMQFSRCALPSRAAKRRRYGIRRIGSQDPHFSPTPWRRRCCRTIKMAVITISYMDITL